jgi:hypothetical protein
MNDFRTRLRSFSPVSPVRDLPRTLAHYGSLGFDAEPYADGDEVAQGAEVRTLAELIGTRIRVALAG